MPTTDRVITALVATGLAVLIFFVLWALVQNKQSERDRDEERQHMLNLIEDMDNLTRILLQDQQTHRCRTEELHRALLEQHGIPYTPLPYPKEECP